MTIPVSIIHPTERKLEQFANLAEGWHYGEGRAIDAASLERALSFNQEAIRTITPETDAFPGLNGEVVFTAYPTDHYLEFTFEPDGTVIFCHEEADREICYEEGLPLQEAKARLEGFKIT